MSLSPIQLISMGIDKGDWSLVCDGYTQMTGDDVNVPVQKSVCDISQVSVVINGNVYPVFDCTKDITPTKLEMLEPDREILERANKQLQQEAVSVEEDESDGLGIFTTSKKESMKLSKSRAGKSRELRPKFTPVNLKCSGCKNNFDVHPDLVPIKLDKGEDEPEFRCDSCMGKSKIR